MASILICLSICVSFVGCDTNPITPPASSASTESVGAESPASSTELSSEQKAATEKQVAQKPAAAQAKPAEPPLDENVKVEELLKMRLATEDLSVGWIRLFDGQSMMGWKNAGTANWKIEDGALFANAGESGLLCTTVRFSDFELILEYKGTDTTNSGVFLRTAEKPTDPAKDCYELNIAPPDNPFPTGSLVGRIKVNEQVDEPESGEWNTLHALVDRDHIQAWVNGQLAVDYHDTTGLACGHIGLQFREGTIRFRDIRVRPIAYAVLPAKDLKDFNQPAGAVQVERTESGGVTLTGGKGHLELLQPHANCFIQVAVQTLAENVNSGLFFRCIPGEDMNGYECQIHHGFKDDRRRPVDAGMGALFRRQPARAVLSDADAITYVTVAADGPRMSTWVNGVQVTEFEDTRPANANPRKGLRLEAGTVMLQAHDPTCKVRFDSLSICPLP
jgi:hypothetical protein